MTRGAVEESERGSTNANKIEGSNSEKGSEVVLLINRIDFGGRKEGSKIHRGKQKTKVENPPAGEFPTIVTRKCSK